MSNLKLALLCLFLLGRITYSATQQSVYSRSPVVSPPQIENSLPVAAPAAVSSSPTTVHLPSPQSISPSPGPAVNIRYNYYSLNGATADELRKQMNQQGPFDDLEKRRYDANTTWFVHWSYRYTQTNHSNQVQCVIASVLTKVEVVFSLPQWEPPLNASPMLFADWNRYIAALQIHEDGHKDHGIAAGRDILTELQQFPAYASCDALKAAAFAAAQAVIRRYNYADIEYDRITQHGYTQGAVFPETTTVLQ